MLPRSPWLLAAISCVSLLISTSANAQPPQNTTNRKAPTGMYLTVDDKGKTIELRKAGTASRVSQSNVPSAIWTTYDDQGRVVRKERVPSTSGGTSTQSGSGASNPKSPKAPGTMPKGAGPASSNSPFGPTVAPPAKGFWSTYNKKGEVIRKRPEGEVWKPAPKLAHALPNGIYRTFDSDWSLIETLELGPNSPLGKQYAASTMPGGASTGPGGTSTSTSGKNPFGPSVSPPSVGYWSTYSPKGEVIRKRAQNTPWQPSAALAHSLTDGTYRTFDSKWNLVESHTLGPNSTLGKQHASGTMPKSGTSGAGATPTSTAGKSPFGPNVEAPPVGQWYTYNSRGSVIHRRLAKTPWAEPPAARAFAEPDGTFWETYDSTWKKVAWFPVGPNSALGRKHVAGGTMPKGTGGGTNATPASLRDRIQQVINDRKTPRSVSEILQFSMNGNLLKQHHRDSLIAFQRGTDTQTASVIGSVLTMDKSRADRHQAAGGGAVMPEPATGVVVVDPNQGAPVAGEPIGITPEPAVVQIVPGTPPVGGIPRYRGEGGRAYLERIKAQRQREEAEAAAATATTNYPPPGVGVGGEPGGAEDVERKKDGDKPDGVWLFSPAETGGTIEITAKTEDGQEKKVSLPPGSWAKFPEKSLTIGYDLGPDGGAREVAVQRRAWVFSGGGTDTTLTAKKYSCQVFNESGEEFSITVNGVAYTVAAGKGKRFTSPFPQTALFNPSGAVKETRPLIHETTYEIRKNDKGEFVLTAAPSAVVEPVESTPPPATEPAPPPN